MYSTDPGTIVRESLQRNGLNQYRQYAEPVIRALAAQPNVAPRTVVTEALRNNSVQSSYHYLADPVVLDLEAAFTQGSGATHGSLDGDDGFDRATAAEVIRAFITDGSPHLGTGGGGATEEQVTALLVLAGLEDAPAPAAVTAGGGDLAAEVSRLSGLVDRLVAFGERHGFRR